MLGQYHLGMLRNKVWYFSICIISDLCEKTLRMCRLEIVRPESAQCYPTLGRLTSAQPWDETYRKLATASPFLLADRKKFAISSVYCSMWGYCRSKFCSLMTTNYLGTFLSTDYRPCLFLHSHKKLPKNFSSCLVLWKESLRRILGNR